MSKSRSASLSALLLAAVGAMVSGCVAYDPYYPAYGESVVVPPPAVYAVPPPIVVEPGYWHRPWRDGWGGYPHHRYPNGGFHGWGRPGGPRGWR